MKYLLLTAAIGIFGGCTKEWTCVCRDHASNSIMGQSTYSGTRSEAESRCNTTYAGFSCRIE